MDDEHGELELIRALLYSNPEGLNIKAISSELHLNRNTVARHLGTLQLLGYAEMRKAGISHIYCPSTRVPESAIRQIITDPLLILTPAGTLHGMNAAAEQAFHCRFAEVAGRKITTLPFQSLLPRDLLRQVRSGNSTTQQKEKPPDMGKNQRSSQENIFSIIPAVSGGGEPLNAIILHSSYPGPGSPVSRSIPVAWNVIPDLQEMILRAGPDNEIIDVNPLAARRRGMTATAIIGMTLQEYFSSENWGKIEETIASLSQENQSNFVDFIVEREESGLAWECWNIRVIYAPDTKAEDGLRELVLYGRDVTSQRRAEAQALLCRDGLDEVIRTRMEDLRLINSDLYQEVRNREDLRQMIMSLQTAIDTAGDILIGLDHERRVISWNSNALTLLQYTPEGLAGVPIEDLLPGAPVDTLAQMIAGIEDGARLQFLSDMRTRDGRVIPADVSVSLDTRKDGAAFTVVIRDITGWKAAEEARKRLIAIIEAYPYLVAISNPARRIMYINRAGRQLLGLGPMEDVSSMTLMDFYPDPERTEVIATGIPHAIRHGAWRKESRFVIGGGMTIPVEVILIAHTSGTRPVTEFSTIALDITARKEAEAIIRENEQKYHALFESSLDPVLVLSRDGMVIDGNTAACRIFEYSHKDLLGLNITALLSAGEGISPLPYLISSQSGEGQGVELTAQRRDGYTFPTEVSAGFVSIGGTECVLLYVHDITDRLRAGKILQAAAFYARSLLEMAGIPFLITQPDGTIRDVNRSAERFTGIPRGDLIGQQFSSLCVDQAGSREIITRATMETMLHDSTTSIRTRAGAVVPVEVIATAIGGDRPGEQEILLLLRPPGAHG